MGSRVPRLPLLLAAIAGLLLLAHSGEIRERAEEALGRGAPPREAALARGFVLGEDEGIDAATKEDFRRSGLAHLIAVSGQNVTLLGLLALPLLAALGLSLRSRIFWLLALIAAYVPLAGAGPSICRAAIMGALGLLATLAGRRASRLYGLAVAALVLLAIDPGIGADVGWQLSFAAVLGILLLAPPLRGAFPARAGARGLRGALADGAAMTIAATLATAPLIALHFEAVSTTTLFANLLALPAVAPAMWLGMLAAAAGQVPGAPVEPLNAVGALLLAYVAQVAAWCARPGWAYVEVHLGLGGLLASYAAIAAAAVAIRRLPRRGLAALAATLVVLLSGWSLLGARDGAAAGPVAGLRVSVLDVGQGDAILLQPRGAPPVLVDAGPAGGGLTDELREAGVAALGAVVATHDQVDHVGGLPELLGALPVGRVFYSALGAQTLAEVRSAAVPAERLARGAEIRSGRLRLEVLWPPAELLAASFSGADPNALSLVLLARWRRFAMLLTADAEAEAVPLDPGPIDVLKVAHHGSDDAGLAGLLERTRPRLAAISVGAGNPFGHPTPATLATLAAHGVAVVRTDLDGTVVLDVGGGAIRTTVR